MPHEGMTLSVSVTRVIICDTRSAVQSSHVHSSPLQSPLCLTISQSKTRMASYIDISCIHVIATIAIDLVCSILCGHSV